MTLTASPVRRLGARWRCPDARLRGLGTVVIRLTQTQAYARRAVAMPGSPPLRVRSQRRIALIPTVELTSPPSI